MLLGPEPATVGSSSPAVPASNFQVNAVRCVKNEIHNMLAALRHHSRAYGRTGHNWASEERFEREILADQESPVLRSFKDLQTYLDGFDDLRRASAPRFLPRSPSSS